MKYLKYFEKKPEIDYNTISLKSKNNADFRVDIYFDENGLITYIHNIGYISDKYDTKSSNFGKKIFVIGRKTTLEEIQKYCDIFNESFFQKKPVLYCDYTYKLDTKKFNL